MAWTFLLLCGNHVTLFYRCSWGSLSYGTPGTEWNLRSLSSTSSYQLRDRNTINRTTRCYNLSPVRPFFKLYKKQLPFSFAVWQCKGLVSKNLTTFKRESIIQRLQTYFVWYITRWFQSTSTPLFIIPLLASNSRCRLDLELNLVWGTLLCYSFQAHDSIEMYYITMQMEQRVEKHWFTLGCLIIISTYDLELSQEFAMNELPCDLLINSYKDRKSIILLIV